MPLTSRDQPSPPMPHWAIPKALPNPRPANALQPSGLPRSLPPYDFARGIRLSVEAGLDADARAQGIDPAALARLLPKQRAFAVNQALAQEMLRRRQMAIARAPSISMGGAPMDWRTLLHYL